MLEHVGGRAGVHGGLAPPCHAPLAESTMPSPWQQGTQAERSVWYSQSPPRAKASHASNM